MIIIFYFLYQLKAFFWRNRWTNIVININFNYSWGLKKLLCNQQIFWTIIMSYIARRCSKIRWTTQVVYVVIVYWIIYFLNLKSERWKHRSNMELNMDSGLCLKVWSSSSYTILAVWPRCHDKTYIIEIITENSSCFEIMRFYTVQ